MLKTDVCNCIYARSRTVRTLATAVMAVATMLAFQAESFAQPANDLCVNAAVAVDGGNAYDLTLATLDASAPAPLDTNMQNDVWFSYTASCTGELTVETCEGAAGADTVLEIHTGSTCPPAPAILTADDSGCGVSGFSSSITLFVNAGDNILIRVSGWNGGEPIGTLDITCVAGALPACCVGDGTCAELSTADCFANPEGVQFLDGTLCADLVAGECEVQACCATDGTCSDVTTVLCGLLGGTSQGTGTTCATTACSIEACCFPDGSCSDLDVPDCAMMGGVSQGSGTDCATTTCPIAPGNDDCANATVVTTGPNAAQTSNVGAGVDLVEASCQANSNADVWFEWTADCTGLATIDTEGSVLTTSNDTVLSIYEVSCGGAEIACDDDDGTGLLSTVTFPVSMGDVYYIRVAGFSGNTGDINLNIACDLIDGCCLPNGDCQDITVADCANLGGAGQGRPCDQVSCPVATCNCGTVVNTFAFTENFDADEPDCVEAGSGTSGCGLACSLGGLWENRANGLFDDTDFLTDEGGTVSGGTGPSVDATTGTSTGNYAYLETSGDCGEGVAQLISPCLDLTGTSAPTFTFAYHMLGDDLDADSPAMGDPEGSLVVEITTDLCQTVTQEFAVSGQQSIDSTDWLTATVDLTPYRTSTQVRILITATGGGGFTSDIAIDDLVVFDDSATGACCTASGCTDGISLTACNGLGGLYQGDGTDCATTDCVGACCAGDGTCTNATEVSCNANGGNFQGNGTDCATAACDGACCFADGTCSVLGPDDCATAGGDFQGLGSSCTPNPCPQPPANDDCVDPLPEVFDGANPVDLTQATSSDLIACGDFPFDNGNPNGLNAVENDLFFQYTATCTGQLFVDTCGSSFDSRLAIYDDTCPNIIMGSGAVPLECNDDYGNATEGDTGNPCPAPGTFQASLSINVTQGTTYVIRVGSFSTAPQTAMFDLNIDCVGGSACDTCEGDVNGDTLIDGLDIQSFIDCYVADFGSAPSAACGCADAVDDQLIDALDLDAFVVALLNKPNVCDPGACCFFDGATMCTVTSQQICDALGGDFTAGGDCSGDPCPVGRCCSNGGLTCDDVSEIECATIGGTWDAGLTCATDPCPIPPPNDDCDTATVAFDGLNPYDTTNATLDPTAPAPLDTNLTEDIWFVYTATCDGDLTIDTCEMDLLNNDTVLEVHAGSTCPPAPAIASSDDDCGLSPSFASTVTIVGVTTGDEFLIRLSGWNGSDEAGNLQIVCTPAGGPEACCFPDGSCLDQTPADCAMNGGTNQGIGTTCATTSCPQPPPANDDCDNAIAVTTGPNAGQANNGSAGADLVEASCQANSNGDVWFVWTADCDGNATIDTEGSALTTSNDTVLTIYEVSCGGAEIACDDDGGSGLLSTTTFPVLTGEVYYIRVAGFGTNTGDININIACASTAMEACCFPDGSCTDELVGDCAGLGGVGQGGGTDCGSTSCPQPPPANDDCVGATAVTEGMYPYTTVNSTLDPAGPTPTDVNMDNDVWFVYTAGCTGLATIGTCEGITGPDTTLEVYDGGTCPPTVSLADADDTPGCGASGFSSEVSIPVTAGNQYLIRVGGWNAGEVSGILEISCTAAGGPEACCFADGSCSDLTPGDCSMMGGTSQGIGTDCASASCPQPEACCFSDGSCTDSLPADCAGSGGISQGSGTDCATTVCPIPPANDDCANASVVTDGTTMFDTTDATDSGVLPTGGCSGSSVANDVWYEYTASCTGTVTIDTEGSMAPFDDSVLAVYDTSCGGARLGCDDDGGSGLLSTVSVDVTAGDVLIIQVFGFGSTNDGPGQLNIACAPEQPEACCMPDGSCMDLVPSACATAGGTSSGGSLCVDTYCPGPNACAHTLTLDDSFGDGWNGNNITLVINGLTVGTFTLASGSTTDVIFLAETGDVIETNYDGAGSFQGEVSWSITDGNGAPLCSDGPSPAIGLQACGAGACP